MEPFKSPHQVSLLFFENIDHTKQTTPKTTDPSTGSSSSGLTSQQQQSQSSLNSSSSNTKRVCDEIEFSEPVRISLIRIVKPNVDVHQQLKQLKTITDKEGQLKSLEIFARDLAIPTAKYTLLVNAKQITDTKTLNHDVLISLPQPICTDRLVLRGEFSKITLCVYGENISEQEIPVSCPFFAKENFDLDKLPEQKVKDEENKKKKIIKDTNEEVKVNRLVNAAKIAQNIFEKGNYHVNFEQILPRLLIDKNNEKEIDGLKQEMNEIVVSINQFTELSEEDKKHQLHIYRQNIEILTKNIQNLLKDSEETQHVAAHFSGSITVHKDIPPSVVQICLESLNESPSDYIRGLELALELMSCYDYALEFIERGGLNKLYCILSENIELGSRVFSSVKSKVLEVLNAALTFIPGSASFLDWCLNKQDQQLFEGQFGEGIDEKGSAIELEDKFESKDGDYDDDGYGRKKENEGNDDDINEEENQPRQERRKRKGNDEENDEDDQDDNGDNQEDYDEDDQDEESVPQQSARKERRESESSRSRSNRKDNKRKDRDRKSLRETHRENTLKKRSKQQSSRSRDRRDSTKGKSNKKAKSGKGDREKESKNKDRDNNNNNNSSKNSNNNIERDSKRDKQKDRKKDRDIKDPKDKDRDHSSRRKKNRSASRSPGSRSPISKKHSKAEDRYSDSKYAKNLIKKQSKKEKSPKRTSNSSGGLNNNNSKSNKNQENGSSLRSAQRQQSERNNSPNRQRKSDSRSNSTDSPSNSIKEKEIFNKINLGYQIVLFEMTRNSDSDELLLCSRQILHKSLLYFNLQKLEQSISDQLLHPVNSRTDYYSNSQEQSELSQQQWVSKQCLQSDIIARNITTQLQNVLSSMKEQTLINGRLAAGWRFEDAVNPMFIAEKRRNLQRFSVLKEVVIGDIYTLTNENIRMMHQMKLLPCILLALTSPIVRESSEFPKLFRSCYSIIVHILDSRGNALMLARNKEVLKVLIQSLEQLQMPLNRLPAETQGSEQFSFYFSEQNYSRVFSSDESQPWEKILNNTSFIEQLNSLVPSYRDQEKIQIGIMARQLGFILKYSLQLVNTLNQIYAKMMASELDLELVQLLSNISAVSTKSSLSQLALNRFLLNDFATDALFYLFQVNNTEQLLHKQVEISILSETFYNALIFDEGLLTVMFSNQILVNLISMNEILGKNQHLFESSRELRTYAIMLINYMLPMEILIDEQKRGLPALSSELKKKSYFTEDEEEKMSKPQQSQLDKRSSLEILTPKEFRDDFLRYGNLDETNQNLVFIEVALKIFNLQANYNKNVIVNFYEIGLMSTLDHLIKHFSGLLQFAIQKSLASECLLQSLRVTKGRLLSQYCGVLQKTFNLISMRFHFKTAFNKINQNSANNNMNTNNNSMIRNQFNQYQSELGFKHDQLFSEQMETLVSVYLSCCEMSYNRQECISSVSSNQLEIIMSGILSIFNDLLFACENDKQWSQSNNMHINNNNKLVKSQQRLNRLFLIIQTVLINRLQLRPHLTSLLTNLLGMIQIEMTLNIAGYNGSNDNNNTQIIAWVIDSLINPIIDVEYQADNNTLNPDGQRTSLLDSLFACTFTLSSTLARIQTQKFLSMILSFYQYPVTHVLVARFIDSLNTHASILKDKIPTKNDQKEGIETRKQKEQLLNELHTISLLCCHTAESCKNGGFKTDFLFNHGDDELIKTLQLLDVLQEQLFIQQKNHNDDEILSQICSLRGDLLEILQLLVNHEIGCGVPAVASSIQYQNVKLSGQFIQQSENQYLVEDIPQIAHFQEFFTIIANSRSLELPQAFLVSAESNKKKDNYGNSDAGQHNDEIIEEPDYGLDEEEEVHHHLKTDNSLVKNNDLSQSSKEMTIEGQETNGQTSRINNNNSNSLSIRNPNPLFHSTNKQIQWQLSRTTLISLQVLSQASRNIVGQMILLYSDYISYAYKCNPCLRLSQLTMFLMTALTSPCTSKITQELMFTVRVFREYLELILMLATHPTTHAMIAQEKRKIAIKTLLLEDEFESAFVAEAEKNLPQDTNTSSSNSTNSFSLERLLVSFQSKLSSFIVESTNNIQSSNNNNNSNIQLCSSSIAFLEQLGNCQILLKYLVDYSRDKSKQSSKEEKNSELPSEIRSSELCIQLASNEIDRIRILENTIKNEKSSVLPMMSQQLKQICQNAILEGYNNNEQSQLNLAQPGQNKARLNGWLQARYELMDNIMILDSDVDSTAITTEIDENNQAARSTAYSSIQNYLNNSTSFSIARSVLFYSYQQYSQRFRMVLQKLVLSSLSFFQQFDLNENHHHYHQQQRSTDSLIAYVIYGKKQVSIPMLNQLVHLHKRKIFRESIQRYAIAKHVLETPKPFRPRPINPVVSNTTNTNPSGISNTNINTMQVAAAVGANPAAIANAQLQAMANLQQAQKQQQFMQAQQPQQMNNSIVHPNSGQPMHTSQVSGLPLPPQQLQGDTTNGNTMFSVNPSRSIAGMGVGNNANENISNSSIIPALSAGAAGANLGSGIGVMPMLPNNINNSNFMPPAMQQQQQPIQPSANFPIPMTAATAGNQQFNRGDIPQTVLMQQQQPQISQQQIQQQPNYPIPGQQQLIPQHLNNQPYGNRDMSNQPGQQQQQLATPASFRDTSMQQGSIGVLPTRDMTMIPNQQQLRDMMQNMAPPPPLRDIAMRDIQQQQLRDTSLGLAPPPLAMSQQINPQAQQAQQFRDGQFVRQPGQLGSNSASNNNLNNTQQLPLQDPQQQQMMAMRSNLKPPINPGVGQQQQQQLPQQLQQNPFQLQQQQQQQGQSQQQVGSQIYPQPLVAPVQQQQQPSSQIPPQQILLPPQQQQPQQQQQLHPQLGQVHGSRSTLPQQNTNSNNPVPVMNRDGRMPQQQQQQQQQYPPVYQPNNQGNLSQPHQLPPYYMQQQQQQQQHPQSFINQPSPYGMNPQQQQQQLPVGYNNRNIPQGGYYGGPPPSQQGGYPQASIPPGSQIGAASAAYNTTIKQQQPMQPPQLLPQQLQQQPQPQQYSQGLLPPPPAINPPPPPPPQQQPQQQQPQPQQPQQLSQGTNNLSLTSEERRVYQEKLEEIKQLQKNMSDPRIALRIQAIFTEYPKLKSIINKMKQSSSSSQSQQ